MNEQDDDKLADIEHRLRQNTDDDSLSRDRESKRDLQARQQADNLNMGMRAGIELVASIGVGGALGYGLDSWLGTLPLFFITLLILGVCTGFYNIYKITSGYGSTLGFGQLHSNKKNDTQSLNEKAGKSGSDKNLSDR